ncbi:MAG: glycoside hydrolase family 16 protein [Fibrobacterales bacterium]
MKLNLSVLLLLLPFVMVGCFSGPDDDNTADKDSSSDVTTSSEAEMSSDADPDGSSEEPVSSDADIDASSEGNDSSPSSDDDSSDEPESSVADVSSSDETSSDAGDSSSSDPVSSSTGGNVYNTELCGDKCEDAFGAYPGHTLYFYEEFTREIPFADNMMTKDKEGMDWIWTWGDGNFSGNLTRFVKENIEVKTEGDGSLILHQKWESTAASISIAQNGAEMPALDITGGELRTHVNDFFYGIYEVKVRLKEIPDEKNVFGTMFLYKIPRGDGWREIDLEIVPNKADGGIITNVINTQNMDGINDDVVEFDPMFTAEEPGDFSNVPNWDANNGEWYTYTIEWKPNKIVWTCNGEVIRTYTEETDNGAGPVQVAEEPLALFFNFWTPGWDGSGGVGEDELPAWIEFDYVKYYAWDDMENYSPEVLQDMTK